MEVKWVDLPERVEGIRTSNRQRRYALLGGPRDGEVVRFQGEPPRVIGPERAGYWFAVVIAPWRGRPIPWHHVAGYLWVGLVGRKGARTRAQQRQRLTSFMSGDQFLGVSTSPILPEIALAAFKKARGVWEVARDHEMDRGNWIE